MNKILHQITAEPETLWSGACPNLCCRDTIAKRGDVYLSLAFEKKKKKSILLIPWKFIRIHWLKYGLFIGASNLLHTSESSERGTKP